MKRFQDFMEKASPQDKNIIRIEYLAKRERIKPQEAEVARKALAARLPEVIAEGAIVAGYRAFRGELDITQAMEALAARGHSLCLPVIETSDKPLYFRRWRMGEALETGRYGIEIPPAGVPVFRPDVIIVPLVAFDRQGHRLGYGAGYYDRTIRQLRETGKNTQVIGVAYGLQEVGPIAPETHDERLDILVTEKEVLRFLS
jgi:5-formyltetrahydrofolate cyclo-ligase